MKYNKNYLRNSLNLLAHVDKSTLYSATVNADILHAFHLYPFHPYPIAGKFFLMVLGMLTCYSNICCCFLKKNGEKIYQW